MDGDTRQRFKPGGRPHPDIDLRTVPREVTEWDCETFRAITDDSLTPEQEEYIRNPQARFPRQEYVLAVHWHPEQVPFPLIEERVAAMFPSRKDELIIPTQHNRLLTLGDFSGVEVDCFSRGFNRKVQLLLHMRREKQEKAGVLANMLRHTFKYRSSQLFEYVEHVCDPKWEEVRQEAAGLSGSDDEVVEFALIQAGKLKTLLEDEHATTPEEAIKNKLVRNFFDCLRQFYDARFINKVQLYLKTVKELVKENFSMAYFYRTSEIIEEARGIGAGVVIPHPEQFWPILLAGYDVDGIEVWNPQSQQYTEFLITAVNRENKLPHRRNKPVLIFMGDDCHLSEKLKTPKEQDPSKVTREVGFQPAWDDMLISKSLTMAGVDRKTIIDEYRARLGA